MCTDDKLFMPYMKRDVTTLTACLCFCEVSFLFTSGFAESCAFLICIHGHWICCFHSFIIASSKNVFKRLQTSLEVCLACCIAAQPHT